VYFWSTFTPDNSRQVIDALTHEIEEERRQNSIYKQDVEHLTAMTEGYEQQITAMHIQTKAIVEGLNEEMN
jgi:hypothetical protein